MTLDTNKKQHRQVVQHKNPLNNLAGLEHETVKG